jgi:hypothetical protein
MGSVLNEVIRPDVILPAWTEPYAGAIIEPEPSTLWLLLRDFEPLPSPDPLNALMVDAPTFYTKQTGDASVAISAILTG